jgi:hypothetical protein
LKLCEKVTSKDKMILSNIINKFSVPKDKWNLFVNLEKESVQDNGIAVYEHTDTFR